MEYGRDAGFSSKRSGNAGSGPPLPDPAQELSKFLSEFLRTVCKKEDNEEYEPNSLRAFFTSFERHLKKKTMDFAF